MLIRMINMGYETQPMHMHGFHGKVIGSDQRAWYWANTPGLTPTGLGLEKNTLTIGSGEAYEWLIDFGQVTAHRHLSDAGDANPLRSGQHRPARQQHQDWVTGDIGLATQIILAVQQSLVPS